MKIDGGADVEVVDDLRRSPCRPSGQCMAMPRRVGRVVVAVEHHVLGDGELADHAGALAVLGDVGDAAPVALARRGVGDVLAEEA